MTPRIGIVGAGAIGGWVAAVLGAAGHDVRVLARGETRDAIATRGLILSDGGVSRSVAVPVADTAAAHGPCDVVIVAVKAPALTLAAEAARGMIGGDTLIVPMLNGVPWWFAGPDTPIASLDLDGRIAAALPYRQLIGCVVHVSAALEGPGAVRLNFADTLILGEPTGGDSLRVAMLAELFGTSGIAARVSADVRTDVWYKLWGNMTLNPLSALTQATTDRLLDTAPIAGLIRAGMAEAKALGAAIGCPIDQTIDDRFAVTRRLGSFRTSMLADVEAGRAIELEAMLGAPLAMARTHGMATPALDLIHAMTAALADARGLPTG